MANSSIFQPLFAFVRMSARASNVCTFCSSQFLHSTNNLNVQTNIAKSTIIYLTKSVQETHGLSDISDAKMNILLRDGNNCDLQVLLQLQCVWGTLKNDFMSRKQ